MSGIIGMATAVSLPVHAIALTLDCNTANVKELRPFASCLLPQTCGQLLSRYVSEYTTTHDSILCSGRGHICTVPWTLMEPLDTALPRMPRTGLSCLGSELYRVLSADTVHTD